nr:MAG TPA: hypothetical protein [Caudoviricetes sp.]
MFQVCISSLFFTFSPVIIGLPFFLVWCPGLVGSLPGLFYFVVMFLYGIIITLYSNTVKCYYIIF